MNIPLSVPRDPMGVPEPDPILEHRDTLHADLLKIADGTYLPCTERAPDSPTGSPPLARGTTATDARSVVGGKGQA